MERAVGLGDICPVPKIERLQDTDRNRIDPLRLRRVACLVRRSDHKQLFRE